MRILVAMALACALAFGQDAFAVINVTVVDGAGTPPYRGTVVVRGDRIVSAGPAETPPAGARLIDGKGHTLTPGFFDLHTHLPYSAVSGTSGDWGKILKAYLYCGVTSVVDFGTYPETFEPMRRLIREGVIPGPRIHLAARMTTPLGHGAEGGRGDFFSLEVQTPGEARAAMKRLLAYQPDAIKVFTDGWRYGGAPDMSSMEPETLAAIVEQAHAKGVEVLTHTVTLERAKIAARAGVDVIAHGIGDRLADDELMKILREKGTTYAPTLAVYESKPRGLWAPLLKVLLEPLAMEAILRGGRSRAAGEPDPHRVARWKNLMENTALLRGAGARFGLGTDAGVTGTYHGWSSLREMQLLVAGGLTPLEALTAATGNSAKAIHVEEERGTISPGKLADMVLIEGLPHENIDHIERIRRVWLGGRELDRPSLTRDIASTEMTRIPIRKAAALVDDLESPDGRTRLDTLRVNATDSGTDHSTMTFGTVLRAEGGHSLSVHALMSHKSRPFGQIIFPLSRGAVEPVDVTAFQGVQFEARGDGEYRLVAQLRSVRNYQHPGARFTAGAQWRKIDVPFTALGQAWSGKDVLALAFEIARPAGEFGWLELDNIRFF